MAVKVALIQLPHFYGDGMSRDPESYPLGLGYLSAVLTRAGIEHTGIDLWVDGLSVDEALARKDLSGFDVLGISSYATQYSYLKPYAEGLRRLYPDAKIVCGGAGPTFSWRVILEHTPVDVCVISEGEETFLDLLANLDSAGSVRGIALRDAEGRAVRTEPRPPIRDLTSLPFPNRDLFDFERYTANSNAVRAATDSPELREHPRRAADIIAGRGCPYTCTFCSRTFSGCRLRPIDDLLAEVAMLVDRYQVGHLQFNDELVVVNKRRTLELCEGLRPFGLTWACQGRINQVDREILEAMRDAGCTQIGYGVESASQSILDAMDKRVDATTIVPVIEMTREVGIEPIIQYMYGFPGETDETIAATERFFAAIDHPYIGFTTTPIPGSALYDESVARGVIGDEEDYLLRLDSGYNLSGRAPNLTGFTDEELVAKKRRLIARVTHNYLKRRPLAYARYLAGFLARRLTRLAQRVRRSIPGRASGGAVPGR